jgi:hypothetical protein
MASDTLELRSSQIVHAELNYLGTTSGKPHNYTFTPPNGETERNYEIATHRVAIQDLRPDEERTSLDREGFAAVRWASSEHDFLDEVSILDDYYPESESLLKAVTGADRVFIFDHTIRRRIPGQEDRRDGPRQPVARVHVDQTARSGEERVRLHLGAEAEALLRGRVQIINVWRPIRGPVLDRPLAVCDARSVHPADLVPTDLIYPDRVGETYSVSYNPSHRWFYLSAMCTDEVLLLKCYDSKTDGRARFAPHTAFVDPNTPQDVPPRESIELRALVFHRED